MNRIGTGTFDYNHNGTTAFRAVKLWRDQHEEADGVVNTDMTAPDSTK